jgi:hypothetical protein
MGSDLIAQETWKKSSRSNGSGGQCVEVGTGSGVFGVRDTKDRDSGTLIFGDASWIAFVTDVKAGRFDR